MYIILMITALYNKNDLVAHKEFINSKNNFIFYYFNNNI